MQNLDTINLLILLICTFLLMLTIINSISISKQKKRINSFFGTKKNKNSIEAMLIEYISTVNSLEQKYVDLEGFVRHLDDNLSFCVQKVGFVRYNPFYDSGGELSFAIALLDRNNKGFVINTIHSREQSYSYAKSVVGLESDYTLSDEEKKAISIAINEVNSKQKKANQKI